MNNFKEYLIIANKNHQILQELKHHFNHGK